MKCIYCGFMESRVIDSRQNEDGTSIRRRRECAECKKRFTTYETIEASPVMVIKKSGGRQMFSPSKLRSGILRACDKRPVSISKIDKLVSDIERKIAGGNDREIYSSVIGEYVMEGLRQIDQVAYVRFAAVYRQFQDIDSWLQAMEDLKNGK